MYKVEYEFVIDIEDKPKEYIKIESDSLESAANAAIKIAENKGGTFLDVYPKEYE